MVPLIVFQKLFNPPLVILQKEFLYMHINVYSVCLWEELSSGSAYYCYLRLRKSDLLLMKIKRDKVFLHTFNLFLVALGRPRLCYTISGSLSCSIFNSLHYNFTFISTGGYLIWFSYCCVLCNSFHQRPHILPGHLVLLLCS